MLLCNLLAILQLVFQSKKKIIRAMCCPCWQASPALTAQQLEAKRKEEEAKLEEEMAKAKARRQLMAQVGRVAMKGLPQAGHIVAYCRP